MKLALGIEPAAEEDIIIGYRWYEERQLGFCPYLMCEVFVFK